MYTERGVEARSIVGPFTEGDTLRLLCRVEGGSPSPQVTWWEGSELLDATLDSSDLGYVTNTLEISPLTREDLHRTLTCQATNTNLTAPLAATVTLDMNCECLCVCLLGCVLGVCLFVVVVVVLCLVLSESWEGIFYLFYFLFYF